MWHRTTNADRALVLVTIFMAELSYALPLDSYLDLVAVWSICVVGYGLVAAYRLDPLRAFAVPTAALFVIGRVNAYAALHSCAIAWVALVAVSVLLLILRACYWLSRWFRSRPRRRRSEAGLVSSAVRGRPAQVRAEDVLAEMGFGPK